MSLGRDFLDVIGAFEGQSAKRGAKVFQVLVNLGEAWCGRGVSLLRERGLFLGGFLPRWFDSDGLLLQKVVELPSFESIRLFSRRAQRILSLVGEDVRRSSSPSLG